MALFQRKTAPETRALEEFNFPTRTATTLDNKTAIESLSAVFRCIQVIANTTSNLELDKLSGLQTVGQFSNFAEDMTDREFISATVVSMAGWGVAYWRKPNVKLKAWKYRGLIHPDKVTRQNNGTYRVVNSELGIVEFLNSEQITVIPFLLLPDAKTCVSPLGSLARTITFANDLNDYAGTVFTSGAFPSGVLATDQILPPTVADDVKRKFVEKFAKASREPAVLTGGLKYSPLTISPVDAEFVNSFNLSVQDIARAFGVPASFMGVGSGDSLTYATSEGELQRFKTTTLTAYTTPIEQAFSADRGAESEKIRFDYQTLERADTSARYSAYAMAQVKADGSGWLTVDEIRAKEGLPPLGVTNG